MRAEIRAPGWCSKSQPTALEFRISHFRLDQQEGTFINDMQTAFSECIKTHLHKERMYSDSKLLCGCTIRPTLWTDIICLCASMRWASIAVSVCERSFLCNASDQKTGPQHQSTANYLTYTIIYSCVM